MTTLRTGLSGLLAILATAMALALAPAAALAQDGDPAEAEAEAEENFSPSHLAKAQRVIELTHADEGFDDILPIVAEQTQALIIRNNPALTAEAEAVTTEKAIELAATRVELNRTVQKIWARRYSEEELDQLIAFFTSPVGEKFADLTTSIAALSVGASKQWGDRLATELLTEVREELRARGHQL